MGSVYDRVTAAENRAKRMQRVESTRDFQRTGGTMYRAEVFVPYPAHEAEFPGDGHYHLLPADPARPHGENSADFATERAAVMAAVEYAKSAGGIRAKVTRYTITIASESGWHPDPHPCWKWKIGEPFQAPHA